MKLELKHLAPYLPYKLKIFFNEEDVAEIVGLELGRILLISSRGDFGSCDIGAGKLVLHPLSDLTKEIEVNEERFVPIDKLDHEFSIYDNCFILHLRGYDKIDLLNHPMEILNKLFEWHFDVFDLINEGLAIDINTLTKQQ